MALSKWRTACGAGPTIQAFRLRTVLPCLVWPHSCAEYWLNDMKILWRGRTEDLDLKDVLATRNCPLHQ